MSLCSFWVKNDDVREREKENPVCLIIPKISLIGHVYYMLAIIDEFLRMIWSPGKIWFIFLLTQVKWQEIKLKINIFLKTTTFLKF